MPMTLWSGGVAANGVSCQAVSQDGQAPEAKAHGAQGPDDFCVADFDPAAAVIVATFPMPAGLVFDWHTHPDHQLAWAASGVLTVRTDVATWVLPPTRALWIPAGVRHETLSAGAATMRSAYVRPELCSIDWPEPTPVSASPLLAELIGYLEATGLDPDRRAHAETVLVDLLRPVAMTTIEVRMPADDRARQVADALHLEPADGRTLAEWGHQVGASERTLARAFLSDTGISFGRWRTLLRLHSALLALADGEPVGNVARHVGYESDSAFVAAFRRETGVTPAAYFRGHATFPAS
jgi:AraC-like DNA-binding protein/quercetin dioxygenase-like cupin family protein